MSNEHPPDQEPQNKPKHAGGRPRKPVPAPPPPPPARNSLEETLCLGDQAALAANSAGKLRWYTARVQIVKEIQARADDERRDTLQIYNERLREKVEALEKEKQRTENELASKDEFLINAEKENERLRGKLKEMTDGHNKQVLELTGKMDAAVGGAEGLLAVVRFAILRTGKLSETDRIEYAAQLMYFNFEQREVAERLEKLVKDPEAHAERFAKYRERPRGVIEEKLNYREADNLIAEEKQAIAKFMQADVERLRVARSNIIPDAVMNQVFEILSVTREQVRPLFATKWQERSHR